MGRAGLTRFSSFLLRRFSVSCVACMAALAQPSRLGDPHRVRAGERLRLIDKASRGFNDTGAAAPWIWRAHLAGSLGGLTRLMLKKFLTTNSASRSIAVLFSDRADWHARNCEPRTRSTACSHDAGGSTLARRRRGGRLSEMRDGDASHDATFGRGEVREAKLEIPRCSEASGDFPSSEKSCVRLICELSRYGTSEELNCCTAHSFASMDC